MLKVVRDGSFLARRSREREYQAIAAARALARGARWDETRDPAARRPTLYETLRARAGAGHRDPRSRRSAARPAARRLSRRAIAGPTRCTARSARPARSALLRGRRAAPCGRTARACSRCARRSPRCSAWRRTRCAASTSRARAATATTAPTTSPPTRRCSRARLPGRPVRVQWMREDEHAWEPYGPPMVTQRARRRSTRDGSIADLGVRGVEQHAFDAGPARPATCWPRRQLAHAVRAAAAAARCRSPKAAATATRSRSTTLAERARRAPLRAGDAAARVGAALARRLHERVLDRELHGRTGARRRRRPGRVPAAATSRTPRAATSCALARRALRLVRPGSAAPAAAAASPSPATRTWPRYCAMAVRGGGRARHRRGAHACAWSRRSTAARWSTPTASATRSRAASCSRRAGRLYEEVAFDRTPHHQPRLGRLSDPALPAGARAHRRARHRPARRSRSSAPARPRRARPPRRSPTRIADATARGCASCRSRPTRFALRCSSDRPARSLSSPVRLSDPRRGVRGR